MPGVCDKKRLTVSADAGLAPVDTAPLAARAMVASAVLHRRNVVNRIAHLAPSSPVRGH
jgi:hypothetical protein